MAGKNPDVIIHDHTDLVGVVVVEDVGPNKALSAWVMDTDENRTLSAKEAIPLGHKIALASIPRGEAVLKYGQDIGQAIADIDPGAHVHVHNLKTKRW